MSKVSHQALGLAKELARRAPDLRQDKLLRRLLDAMAERVFAVDEGYRLHFANSEALRGVLGDVSGVLGRPCHEVFQARMKPCAGCPLHEVLQAGGARAATMDLLHGAKAVVAAASIPGPFEGGAPKALVCVAGLELQSGLAVSCSLEEEPGHLRSALARESMERRRAEYAIRASEQRFRDLFSQLGLGYAEFDQSGHLRFSNQAFCQMTGFSTAVPTGLPLAVFVPQAAHLTQAQAAASSWTFEVVYPRSEGRELHAQAVVSSLQEPSRPERGLCVVLTDITEIKRKNLMLERLRDELRSQKEFLQVCLEDLPLGVAVFDPKGTARYLNPAYAHIVGLNRDRPHDLPGLCERVGPEAQEGFQEALGLLSTVGQSGWRGPLTIGGISRREVQLTATTLSDASIILALIDETERTRMEKALAESERRYRGIFEGFFVGICQTDVTGRVLAMNPAMARMLGYPNPADAMARITDLGREHYADPSERLRILDRLRAGDVVRDHEIGFLRVDGSQIWISLNCWGRYDDKERLVGIEGQLSDVTARRRAESERMLLVAAVEQAADAVVIADNNWRIQYANPAFGKLVGEGARGFLGRTVTEMDWALHDEELLAMIDLKLAADQEWSGRLGFERGGRRLVADVTVSPVRGADGVARDKVVLARDRSYEAALEGRLRQAEKLQAVGTLAGGIAHDFNNILTPVILNAELALEGELDEGLRMLLTGVLKAGRRGRELVRQILTFSMRETGKRTSVQLADVARETVDLLAPGLPPDITLGFAADVGLPPVAADAVKLHQVVMNLLTNALQSMGQGPGRLDVSLRCVDRVDLPGEIVLEGERFVRLEVRDTGHGMDKETLGRIFEPFFTTKNPGEGTGMGLSTVHGIVKDFGGEILAESVRGQGSSFFVYLPAATGFAPARGEAGRVMHAGVKP